MKEVSFLLMFFLILAKLFLPLGAEVTALNGQHIVFGTLTPVRWLHHLEIYQSLKQTN
jgi:hypothetical protein